MSIFNTLLHGSAADVAAILSGDNPPDTKEDFRAALTNALDRIDRLERKAAVPAPIHHRYKIEVVPQCEPKNLNALDSDVPGYYYYNAIDQEEAIDKFHSEVAIKVLDYFEIIVEIDG